MGLQRPVEAGPVQLWHAQVTQDHIIGAFLEFHERQPAVGRGVHGVAVTAQQPGHRGDDAGFIIYKQNAAAGDGGQHSSLSAEAGGVSGMLPTGSSTQNIVPWPT